MLLSLFLWIGRKNCGILYNWNWLSVHRASSIGHSLSFLLSNFFKYFIGYHLPCLFSFLISWISHHHSDQWYMVLLNGRFPKLGFFLTELCVDSLPQWPMKYFLWFSSIARKKMVEMLYGAPQWEILQGFFLSLSILSRYSTTMKNEIFPLMLLNYKNNNGRDALWCSTMGDYPRFVYFLHNCV